MDTELSAKDRAALIDLARTHLSLYVGELGGTFDKLLDNEQNWRTGYDSQDNCYWVTPCTAENWQLPLPFTVLRWSGSQFNRLAENNP